MIEAVNSAVANASLVRGSANQVDAARVEISTGNGPVAPRAPFISPFISLDNNFDTAVIQIRDSETGDVLRQFPSEQTLSSRAREAQLSESRETNAANSPVQQQASTSLSIESLSALQAQTTPDVATAQQASVALNTGAQSGQVPQISVDVTA